VPSASTLADLHYAIQIAFAWTDYHLHRFRIRDKEYGIPRLGGPWYSRNARDLRLSDFHFRVNERFLYEYDFTDSWEHQVRIEQFVPPVGLSLRTVQRDLCSTAHAGRQRGSDLGASVLNLYKPYLLERWNAGCHTAMRLLRELRQRGYAGGYGMVAAYVRRLGRPRAWLPDIAAPASLCRLWPSRGAGS
jgi:hypothetical protein